MKERDERVLHLARYTAKRVLQSIAIQKRGRIEFDELVAAGYIAGIPHSEKQSLWRWIRNGMLQIVYDIYGDPKKKHETAVSLRDMKTQGLRDMEIFQASLVPKIDDKLDVYHCLRTCGLTALEMQVVALAFWDDRKTREIASILQKDETWIRICKKRALEKLAKFMKVEQ